MVQHFEPTRDETEEQDIETWFGLNPGALFCMSVMLGLAFCVGVVVGGALL